MNNNANLETNAEEVMKEFAKFNLKEMKKATKSALRKGASVLARRTKKNLRQKLPKASHRSTKYGDRLIDAVRYRVDKQGDIAKVHIMGKRSKGSGTFRLRFFEGGTKIRKQKKTGRNIGKIKAMHFFSNARSSSTNEVYSAIDEQLIKTIKKINDKKINGQ